MELLPIFVCLGLVAVVGLGVWGGVWAYRRERERARQKTNSLYHWAVARGWTYQAEDSALIWRFRGEPFGNRNARALHVLSGRHRGRDVLAFEFTFTTGSGGNSTTYTYLATPTRAPRPWLQVGLENSSTRLAAMLGFDDLQLESEEFNRIFFITAGDKKFAYDVLHPRMMRWLLDDERSRRVPFRFEGSHLLCWSLTENHPGYVIWMADYLMDVADRVPSYVWR
ncbi:MAG: hypothetical protein ACRDT6_14110 [Micromonosporaceae bacterium]